MSRQIRSRANRRRGKKGGGNGTFISVEQPGKLIGAVFPTKGQRVLASGRKNVRQTEGEKRLDVDAFRRLRHTVKHIINYKQLVPKEKPP